MTSGRVAYLVRSGKSQTLTLKLSAANFKALQKGKEFGTVTDVMNFGAGDILEIKTPAICIAGVQKEIKEDLLQLVNIGVDS